MRIIGTAVLILTVTNAFAEDRCLPSDTPRQCVQRLITTRAYDNAQAALGATNPGPSTVASPIRSAVKDFLAAASAHVDGSSVKDAGAAIIIDYSFLKQVNVEATFHNPQPSPAAASIFLGTQSLPRGDDALVTLSYNLLTRHFGRNIDRSLFESMLLPLISKTAPATAAVPTTAYDTPFVQLLPDAAERAAAMSEYEIAAVGALPAVADQLGKDLATLANRQPQLFASGLYHHRAPVVGPNERGFRLTWEIGTDNLNTFRDYGGRDCETRDDCLAAFTDFNARIAKAHRTGRLALAIQYGRTALNDVNGLFNEVATNGLTYIATYGQEIGSFTGKPARFDFALTYDGAKTTHTFTMAGAPTMPTPFVSSPLPGEKLSVPPSSIHDSAAFTITEPVGGNLSVPISFVQANHDDWHPNGKHLRHRENEIHLGLIYQIPSFSRPPQNPTCCCN